MEENKICSFFGHSNVEITDELIEFTKLEIINAINYGCRIFYFGGYSNFDSLCYQILSGIMLEKPQLNIKRVYCVPQEQFLRKKARYFNREDYDEVVYLQPRKTGWYRCIFFRNIAMIDGSDYVIFYAEERERSGAYKTFSYAKTQKNKVVVNLFDNKN